MTEHTNETMNETAMNEPTFNRPRTNEPETNEPVTNEPGINEPGADGTTAHGRRQRRQERRAERRWERHEERRRERRGLDPVTMVFGIGALLVAGTALTNGSGLLPGVDPRWLLAGGAVLVGMLLLVGTLRRPPNRR